MIKYNIISRFICSKMQKWLALTPAVVTSRGETLLLALLWEEYWQISFPSWHMHLYFFVRWEPFLYVKNLKVSKEEMKQYKEELPILDGSKQHQSEKETTCYIIVKELRIIGEITSFRRRAFIESKRYRIRGISGMIWRGITICRLRKDTLLYGWASSA